MMPIQRWKSLALVFGAVVLELSVAHAESFVVVDKGEARCVIALDLRGSTLSQSDLKAETKGVSGGGTDAYSLVTGGRFLAERIGDLSAAAPEVRFEPPAEGKSIVISLAENYPDIARAAGLDFDARAADPVKYYDAFCIKSSADKLYVLGHTELGCRYGMATLLERLGFRFYSPSPRWWVAPRTKDLAVDLSMTKAPVFFNVEFATNAGHHMNHGNGTETYLWDIQEIWYAMNRTAGARFSPGPRFSAGPFSFDFTRSVKAELEEHPEYFALLPDGQRDIDKPLAARKLCLSNRRMVDLIVQDRLALLEARRSKDRFCPMVSAEYSASYNDCQCPDCSKLGSSTDRVFYLVNDIARAVRGKYPDAYVAIRLTGTSVPSIEVERNVCVSISQQAFVPAWGKKVRFVGIKHGLAGYVPGAGKNKAEQISYYKELVQFSLDNNVKSLQAGLAPAWGGLQTPLLYVATRLFWDPTVNTEALFN
ncbi:DUF4838 domain-containing protein, partial [bacterium]|nr:DUF4838 domain-containing protein [bacterium]